MAKVLGLQMREKGEKLKPARLLVSKLCNQSPQIKWREVEDALKQEGFEVHESTIVSWVRRFKKGSGIRTHHAKRDKLVKATPVRVFAFKLINENPQITGAALHQAVKQNGFEVSNSICYYWLKSFRKGKGEGTYEQKPVTAEEPSEITSKLNLEQIIEAAGSVETLSMLFYQGVMRELGKKDAVNHLLKQECIDKNNSISALKGELNTVTRERNQIMRDWNEKLAKVKIGTLTLDESTKRLVPKL
ncbi:hypothetical protein LCGC14_2429380 [marine sediment metagenome]|uniref:Uncharacterized protein n=1 Tax=marine sediment metagenome TaxID=412755 RepID=A0A0F9BMJ0_9ZZZZ